jgi:hypothetical protein
MPKTASPGRGTRKRVSIGHSMVQPHENKRR